MVKLKYAALAAFAVAAVASTCAFPDNASAATTYKDFSELKYTDFEYQPSEIYYAPNTKFYIKESGASSYTEIPIATLYDYKNLNDSGSLSIKVVNSSAKDKSGNPVDVIYTISNLHAWKEGGHTYLAIDDKGRGTTITNGVLTDTEANLKAGDPIIMWVGSANADGDFSIQYVKQGTETPADIDKVSFLAWDFDVYGESDTAEQMFAGYEGIYSSSGTTTYYYDTHTSELTTSPVNGGIYVRELDSSISHTEANHGVFYKNSVVVQVKDLTNAKYTYHYTSAHAGIAMIFGSVVPYDTPAPYKYIDEVGTTSNRATGGDAFNYIVRQSIPMNLRNSDNAMYPTFASIVNKYSNMQGSPVYSSFVYEDTLDSNITIPDINAMQLEIRKYVVDDAVINASVLYDPNTNKLTITFDASNFPTNKGFYGSTFDIIIPIKVKSSVNVGSIPNTVTSKYTFSGSDTVNTRTSNRVTTSVYHTLIVRHINRETGEEIAETVTTDHEHGYEYTTDRASNLPEGIQLIAVPDNAKGTLNSNTTVIYYYGKPKNPKTLDEGAIPFIAAFVGAGAVMTPIIIAVKKRR